MLTKLHNTHWVRSLTLTTLLVLAPFVRAQSTPTNVISVLPSSGTLNGNAAGIYTFQGASASAAPIPFGSTAFANSVAVPANYRPAVTVAGVQGIIGASIATSLSLVPISSPASGVILKKDETTGLELPVSGTLGPIFTERAETIGKNRWFFGVSHQDFHFTSLNGQSLNGLQLLYQGGDASNLLAPNGSKIPTYPATFNLGMDVRLSQDMAFITYGATSRIDVTVGLPMVHAAVAAKTYNGLIYVGDAVGTRNDGNTPSTFNCWCVDTFTPGVPPTNGSGIVQPGFNQAGLGKTGFGDVLIRGKGTLIERPRFALALGADLRLPSGDEQNYLGSGTTSIRPFLAGSAYVKPLRNGVVIAPHFNVAWQFSGKSILGGQTNVANATSTNLVNGSPVLLPVFTTTKDYLPDVFSWAVGSEVAFGKHNTLSADLLANQIGWIHGIQNAVTGSAQGYSPLAGNLNQTVTVTGLINAGRTSYGQYTGSFGWKARLIGNLVFTANVLVRLDSNGLTARVAPLYGLGYSY